MTILLACAMCGGAAYARHAYDTERLCRSCWKAAPKRNGKVNLLSSETPSRAAKVFKHLPSSHSPVVTASMYLIPIAEIFGRIDREAQIDQYWEKHPELTRKQVERKLR